MSGRKEGNHEEGNGKECVCNDRACALVDPRSRILRRALAHRRDLNAHRHYFGPVGLVTYGQSLYGQHKDESQRLQNVSFS